MKHNAQFKKLIKRPLFSAKEARKVGISPSQLHYYVRIQRIKRLARGVYRGIDSRVNTDFRWEDLVLTVKSVPNGVVCLTSALAIYGLTEEVPRVHWIAIPHATTAPKRELTKFVRMRDSETGKTEVVLGKESIPIFDRERTIIDAFRYLGKETAIKTLKEAIKSKTKKLDLTKLQKYAKKMRVNLNPYLLVLTT